MIQFRGSLKTIFALGRGPWLTVDCRKKNLIPLTVHGERIWCSSSSRKGSQSQDHTCVLERHLLKAIFLVTHSNLAHPVSAELKVFSGRMSGDEKRDKLMEG